MAARRTIVEAVPILDCFVRDLIPASPYWMKVVTASYGRFTECREDRKAGLCVFSVWNGYIAALRFGRAV